MGQGENFTMMLNNNRIRKNRNTLVFLSIFLVSLGDAILKTPQTHLFFFWVLG